jgi:hypothetical protein
MSTQEGADQPPTNSAPATGEIGEQDRNDLDPTAAALAHRLVETARMAARLEIRIEWLEHQLRELRGARSALDSGIEAAELALRGIRSESDRLRSLTGPISAGQEAAESEELSSVFPAPSSPESEFLRERQAEATGRQADRTSLRELASEG